MSDSASSAYTIAANLRWFAVVYLLTLLAMVAVVGYLQTLGVTLPATGLGIGLYAGIVAVAGQRFAERRDWTGRDRNLLSLGYVAVALALSCVLATALLAVDSTSFAIIANDGAFVAILAGALMAAALIYFGMARLMLMIIARRRAASQIR